MNDYTLYNADCLDILPTLEPQSVDAIICDPPYGTTACKWDSVIPFAPMWEGVKRVLKPRGACVLFGSQPFTSALVMSNIRQYRLSWVWIKNLTSGHRNAKRMPLRSHEDVIVFGQSSVNYYRQMIRRTEAELKRCAYKSVATKSEGIYRPGFPGRTANRFDNVFKSPTSTIDIECVHHRSQEKVEHPTQKPLALLEYLVKTYTNAGDVVLDFAMGSGTTGHACGNLDRRFIGIEKDANYYAIAQERIATAYAPLRMMQEAV